MESKMLLENTSTTPETNALKSEVEKILSEIPDFVDENKALKINIIKDYAECGDVKLLEPLLKNQRTKRAFFKPVLDSFVFNSLHFKEFLEYSSACNSYSKYLGQKIGLYMGDSSLLDRNEVVLNFPFKDCVLEGGQRKEDGLDSYFEYDEKKGEYAKKQSKRREVFYNEVLAQDEIDSLFSPKAFCNAKRYEKGKESSCIKLNRDAELNKKRGLSEDTITDNLIIKGNNLLALHSLKKEFAGKVKLIYIDPPYNTGNDGFAYNDNFNHSSWLTFMKNRLEVARELLREDGCIFISIDDNECAYLKILCDEIFKRENYVATFPWRKRTAKSDVPFGISQDHEFILCYAKGKLFNGGIEKERKYYKTNDFPNKQWRFHDMSTQRTAEERPNSDFTIVNPKTGEKYPVNKNAVWRITKNDFQKYYDENRIIFPGDYDFLKISKPVLRYWKDADQTKAGENFGLTTVSTQFPNNIGMSQNGTKEISELLDKKAFSYPKPESLISYFLEIATKESDIILDYHLGSGTTAAVAHKMNRQYIGVEQMDYIQNVTVERLKKVIEGEQGGISKSVNWQGGGSFVYLELAKKNEKALEQISNCKSLEELVQLFDELCTKYFLHYNVRIKEFRKEIETERFKQLNLKQQKEMFCRMLDLNQLYVNADDRHDKNSGLSKNDIAVTEDFYQLKKDGE